MITLFIWFLGGCLFGIIFTGFLFLQAVKTSDYTVIHGRPRWVKRIDRYNLTYEELKEKYK